MNSLMAIVQAILTFIGISFIGLVFYSQLSSPYNWIFSIAISIIGFYLSFKVYRMIKRRGYIATASGDNSSYELDNLKPTPGSGVIELSPEELENRFNYGKIELSEVTVTIWGDWKGRRLNLRHEIRTIEYDVEKHILIFFFKDYCKLRIRKPHIIHFTTNYLKILKAHEIEWEVPNQNEPSPAKYHYLNVGIEIKTKSNTNWIPKSEDLGIGMNALYLQG